MSDENPFDETPSTGPDGSFVELTIKAGKFQPLSVTVRKATLELVEADLPRAIKAVVGAQASLERAAEEAEANKPAAPGQLGKPATANQSTNTDLPFADSAKTEEPSVTTCKHGERTLAEHGGKRGWICPRAKGDPDRCVTVFE